MTIASSRAGILAASVIAFCVVFPATAQDTEAPASALDGYRSYEAMTVRLRHFAEEHPELVRLESTGKTHHGRDVWMVEVGLDSGTPTHERPALLVAAGFEGTQLVGSELAVEVIHHLIHGYAMGEDESLKTQLEESVFYFFPRVNPDATERMFAAVQTGSRLNMNPFDDDNDGRTDEDGPDDLNGDGMITLMRVADPEGPYRMDADEPRLMVKADAAKGEAAGYALYWEGTDDDGDGFHNEDGPGGIDAGRNFQHEYPYYTRGAGPHMVSEFETRALMDFVIAHRNIAAVLVYGEHDNLVTPPYPRTQGGRRLGEWPEAKPIAMNGFADAASDEALDVGLFAPPRPTSFFRGFGQQETVTPRRPSGRRPATTVSADDLAYFTAASEKYRELTGLKARPATRKPEGTFAGYGYYQFGVPSFETPGWAPVIEDTTQADGDDGGENGGPGLRSGSRSDERGGRSDDESVDAALLEWMDKAGVDGFVDWAPFEHPTLGAVEIGGFKPFEAYNPPFPVIEELTPKQGAFVAHLASQFARVSIADVQVTDHGGGIFRIEAEVENAGVLPTALAHGVTARSVRPTMVQLDIDPDDLVSGAAKTSFFQALEGSGRRETFEWIVRGDRGDTVWLKVASQKGGSDTRRITLQ